MSPKTHKLLSILLLLLLVANYLPLVAGAAYAVAEALNRPVKPSQLTYPIAIIGDYPRDADDEGDLYTLLINNGYSASDIMQYDSVSAFMTDLGNGQLYSVVILNRWSSSSGPADADEILEFVKALDIRDIPLLILDAGYTSYTGGDAFYDYRSDLQAEGYPAPEDQIQKWPEPDYVLIDPVNTSHPIFSGVPDLYYLGDTAASSYVDYTAWSLFTISVTRLAWLNDTYNGYQLYGIAEWTASGGEKWIFMAAGSGRYVRYTEVASDGQYSGDQATVFVNTVGYLISTGNPHQPPKGVVYGYVTDAVTGNPVVNATVVAGTVSNTTNASGYYILKLDPGTYTVTVSKEPLYLDASFTVTIAGGDTHEVNVTLDRKPVIHGYVVDAETGAPLEGVRIYTNVTGYENYTDSTGYYMLRLGPGTYTFYVEHEPFHKIASFVLSLAPNNVYEHNISMLLKPKADVIIALIGDEYDNDLYNFLREDYAVILYPDIPSFLDDKDHYEWKVIILNQIGGATSDDLVSILSYADMMNIGIIVLDTYGSYSPAGYKFYYYRDTLSSYGYPAPADRTYSYKSSSPTDIQVEVLNTTHPIFANITSPYPVVDATASEVDYAYYGSFTMPVTILANLTDAGSNLGIAIAEWKAPGNESWIFISYGCNLWNHYNTTDYGYFSSESKKVLIQAIDYVNKTHVPPPHVKIYGYVYDEGMNPISGAKVWIEGADLENYTDSTGYYEINDVFGNANYTMKAAKLGYYIETRIVSVGDTDIQVDFILHNKPPTIVVVGDHETSSGKLDINLTIGQWWTIQEAANWRELIDIATLEGQVILVIFNAWGSPSPSDENVSYVLSILDSNNIPIIFLQGGQSSPNGHAGIYQLYLSRNTLWSLGYPAPNSSNYKYPDGQYLFIKMLDPTNDIFKNIAPDEDEQFLIMRQLTSDADYYGFTWPAENLSAMNVLGLLNDTYYDHSYPGVAIWTAPGGEKWIFLGHGGSTGFAMYSEPGSYNQYSYKMISLLNNSIHIALGLTPPTLTGTLEGTVTDQDSNPIEGAMVEIVELGLINYTDAAGHYMIKNVPTGTYTLRITKKGYYPYTATITIGTGTNTYDAVLTKASHVVAVIGDYESDISNYLWENQSIYAISYDNWSAFLVDLCSGNYNFSVVVINTWGSTITGDELVNALKLLDAYNLPVIFLDGYGTGYDFGAQLLYEYNDKVLAAGYPAPETRSYSYSSSDYIYITMLDPTHPLFNGITPDTDNMFYVGARSVDYPYADYAYYTFPSIPGLVVIGNITDTYDDINSASIAVWSAPGGETWIIMSTGASYYWMKYSAPGGDDQYSAKMWKLLVNAIVYANTTRGAPASSVVYDVTVIDEILDGPVENATILVNETGATFYTGTDGTVTITLPLHCGNYTLIVSKSGYTTRIISLYGYVNTTLTVYLPQYGNGTITGYVYDAETGDPISGALVYIPGVNSTTTRPDGSFALKVPSGVYTVYAVAPKYYASNISVTVPANTTVSVTFHLEKMPSTVLVVGDYYGDIKALLESLGYNVETVENWSVMLDKLPWGNYIAVIINGWGDTEPSAENVTTVLSTLDSMDIPVLFLDGNDYSDEYFGVHVLYSYRSNVTALGYPAPAERSDTYSDYGKVYILMLCPQHPLFNDITPDTDNMFLLGTGTGYYEDNDYAYYTFNDTPNLMLLGNIYDAEDNRNATTIAVWISPGGARWVYLGASASGYWMRYTEPGRDDQYSANAAKLLANALSYAITYNTTPTLQLVVNVYDKLDNTTISGANVTVAEIGSTVFTNGSGTAVFTVPQLGFYTVYVSMPGYFNETHSVCVLDVPEPTVLSVYLRPYGYGNITGYVTDAETGEPIAGANVSIPGVAWTLTDSSGRYTLRVPSDVYTTIVATAINYYDKEISVNIVLHPGEVKVQNITMEKKPPAVILVSTDYSSYYTDYAEDVKAFIESLGYYIEWYTTLSDAASAINAGRETYLVILNKLYNPTASDLLSFIQLVDEKNISLIILDSYGSYAYHAGYYFYEYSSTLRSYGYIAPATRTYYYPSPEYVTLRIEKELYGFTYDIGFTEYSGVTSGSLYFDYAVYTFEPTDLVDVVVTLHDTDNNVDGVAVAVWYPSGGERWIFISYGASHWVKYMEMGSEGQFSDEAKLVFARAINYALMRGTKIEVENFTVTAPRENGVVMPGDQIRITGRVYYWIGNNKYPLANETLDVYMLSTPYVIGSVTTGPDGSFDTTITVPNSTPTGEHAIGLGGASYTIYVLSPPGQPGANRYLFLPAPEPQLLPLLLLAALLLIVMFKKRR